MAQPYTSAETFEDHERLVAGQQDDSIEIFEAHVRRELRRLDEQFRRLVDQLKEQIDKTAQALYRVDTAKVPPTHCEYVEHAPGGTLEDQETTVWRLNGTTLAVGFRSDGIYDGFVRLNSYGGKYQSAEEFVRVGHPFMYDQYAKIMVALEELRLLAAANSLGDGLEG